MGGAAGSALANRPSQLPANRVDRGNLGGNLGEGRERGERLAQRDGRGEGRGDQQWQQRTENRRQNWDQWRDQNQSRLNNFHDNQQDRWDQINNAREDRQSWRDQNREDWQEHRNQMWDYRSDRANEIWDHAGEYYDNLFDSRWWGAWTGGAVAAGAVGALSNLANPWWWWQPATYSETSNFVEGVSSQPVYVDYGMNVDYEGSTVYVNNQPIPAEQYSQPVTTAATAVAQPPPPTPPAPGKEAEWMPLGVFALVQEEKGDPTMFFQLSVNRAGTISGAYTNAVTNDEDTVAGQVEKSTQRVGWRIDDNTGTIFETSLGNLTLDVAPIVLHFGKDRTQTWLLVRMPDPAAKSVPPQVNQKPPPLGKTGG